LILRLPYIDGDRVKVYSYGFLIKDNEVYIFNRNKEEFEKLRNLEDLHKYLNKRVDKILSKLNNFHIQIAKIEDDLYKNKISKDFLYILNLSDTKL